MKIFGGELTRKQKDQLNQIVELYQQKIKKNININKPTFIEFENDMIMKINGTATILYTLHKTNPKVSHHVVWQNPSGKLLYDEIEFLETLLEFGKFKDVKNKLSN